jgi:hypothetical protein
MREVELGLATPSLGCSIFFEPGTLSTTHFRISASVLSFDEKQSSRQTI